MNRWSGPGNVTNWLEARFSRSLGREPERRAQNVERSQVRVDVAEGEASTWQERERWAGDHRVEVDEHGEYERDGDLVRADYYREDYAYDDPRGRFDEHGRELPATPAPTLRQRIAALFAAPVPQDRAWAPSPRYVSHRSEPRLWRRVRGVFQGVGPRNYVRPDARIMDDVCERLSYHPYVNACDVDVTVKNGEVTLSGTIDDRESKRLAEDVALDVAGVKDVHNELRVR